MRSIRFPLLCTLALLYGSFAFFGACSTTPSDQEANTERTTDGGTSATCNSPQTACDDSCVNTQTNPSHCGSCGNACAAPSFAMAVSGGSSSTPDRGEGVAIDSEGNVYVVGTFGGTATFGTIKLTSAGSGTQNRLDVFVAKLDNQGQWVWAKRAGGKSNDIAGGIAVDGSGNVYVTGAFAGEGDFGLTTLVSAGEHDVFVARIDKDGTWSWAQRAGTNARNVGNAITLDSKGNVYLLGAFSKTILLGNDVLTSAGEVDVFVSKLNAKGEWQWSKRAGGPMRDEARGLAVDASGNVYVAGGFMDKASFGTATLTSAGTLDIFVAKLNSNGAWQWSQQAGGSESDRGQGVAVDSNGHVYLTGSFEKTASFGSETLTDAGGADLFVSKLDSKGKWLWSQQAGGSNAAHGAAISVDDSGNVYIAGSFAKQAVFGATTLTGAGTSEVFVGHINPEGGWLWAKQAKGSEGNDARGMVLNGSSSYITGGFSKSAIFSSTTLTDTGQGDVFVTKLQGQRCVNGTCQ